MAEPIEAEYAAKMQALAETLDEFFNGSAKGHDRKVCFVVLVAGFGDSKRCNYISNGNRADCIAMMKETAARLSGQKLKPGRA